YRKLFGSTPFAYKAIDRYGTGHPGTADIRLKTLPAFRERCIRESGAAAFANENDADERKKQRWQCLLLNPRWDGTRGTSSDRRGLTKRLCARRRTRWWKRGFVTPATRWCPSPTAG